MTECSQSGFEFTAHFSRGVEVRFDGGQMTSDGGAVLLRETDRKIGLVERLAKCFRDGRSQQRVSHTMEQMLAQRIYGLALGYEDLTDHDELRRDPLLAVLSGKKAAGEELLAGKSTLNRMELGTEQADRYKKINWDEAAMDALPVSIFIEAHHSAPERIVIDLDVTDVALHGHQEGRFFHGYYDSYCYLPLYIFCDGHLLCARLRTADQDASAGSKDEIARIVGQIRGHWPAVQIILRADSGFCRDELMTWCEEHKVDYLFGFARNERLRKLLREPLQQAAALYEQSRKPARVFTEFQYQTTSGSWRHPRRVIAKAEHIEGKENPRYIVTSLDAAQWPARELYEQTYCARGEMENRIKEQYMLFAGRVSAATMRANQLRLSFSAMAYILMHALRRLGLPATDLAKAQVATIRLRLLKIGARIRITARKVWVSMASSYPLQAAFAAAHGNLRC
jgi:Transposase DDE domain group 1